MTIALPDLTIRPFQPGDLQAVSKIEEACFDEPYPEYFFRQLAEANPQTFLVALSDDSLVGYAIVDRWSDHGHLVSIAVQPEHRRQGVAQQLIDRLETQLSPDSMVRLEVRRSNKAAIQFYTKNGYRFAGVEEHYYKEGEDALIMEKSIRSPSEFGSIAPKKGKSLLVG